jgi:ATPase subunit of ABC transporter with duplicated ATPase domains
MLTQANVLILDEPTGHLDMESITALDRGMQKFQGTILFSTHDHQLVQSVADRIIEFSPTGIIDKPSTKYDEYLDDERLRERRHQLWAEAEPV